MNLFIVSSFRGDWKVGRGSVERKCQETRGRLSIAQVANIDQEMESRASSKENEIRESCKSEDVQQAKPA